MNAHAKPMTSRDHLAAAYALMNAADPIENAMREFIVHCEDADKAMTARQIDPDELRISADWIERTAEDGSQYLNEVADQLESTRTGHL